MRNLKKLNFGTNFGFSLLEVMIASSMLAGVSMVVMQLTSMSAKMQKQVESSYEIQSSFVRLQNYLLVPDICTRNFQGKNPLVKTVLATLVDKTGTVITDIVNSKYATVNNNGMYIINVDVPNSAGTTVSGTVNFNVEYLRRNGDNTTTSITKMFPLRVEATNNVIQTCFSSAAETAKKLVEDESKKLCVQIGGSLDPTGQCKMEKMVLCQNKFGEVGIKNTISKTISSSNLTMISTAYASTTGGGAKTSYNYKFKHGPTDCGYGNVSDSAFQACVPTSGWECGWPLLLHQIDDLALKERNFVHDGITYSCDASFTGIAGVEWCGGDDDDGHWLRRTCVAKSAADYKFDSNCDSAE